MEEAEDSAPSLVDLLQATAKEQHFTGPDMSSDAANEYLDQLLSLPLKSLMAEATSISMDAGNVEGELTNLCFREYPTFISVHRCSAAVTSAFDDFSNSLGGLLDAVPALEDECRTFVRSTRGVQNARAKAQLVQEHQDKLFDLLEIPQLMDTCVRNGYYQEALELSAHTDSLLQRYPDIELVQDVAKEVDGVSQLMLAQLLALLREPIKLPALVKTVGYLRRLGIIDEAELGLAFLISRLSNFQTQLAGLERDRFDPVRYVRKYVDLFREHVFDIISQFTAIFLDGPAGSRNSAASAQLATFVGQCVNDLVELVAAYVPKMNDAASLSSILVQLGYCSLAFARVGLDFSALVTAPFSDAVQTAFTQAVKDASAGLTATLADAERGAGNAAQALLAPEVLPALLAADSPLGFVKWDGNLEALPTTLARFPPLAILVNAHLSALNALRLLAPIALHPRLAATQAAALNECTHAVAKYVRAAVALSDSLAATSGGAPTTPAKGRGGRAALIRHNSETQLTPEARAARRRETQRVCVAFADTWATAVVPLLRSALDRGVYDGEVLESTELGETLDALQAWVRDQHASTSGSSGAGAGAGAYSAPNGAGARVGVAAKSPSLNGTGALAAHPEGDGGESTTVSAEPEEMTPSVDTHAAAVVTPPIDTPAAVETPAVKTPAAVDTPTALDTPAVETPALTSGVATPAMFPPPGLETPEVAETHDADVGGDAPTPPVETSRPESTAETELVPETDAGRDDAPDSPARRVGPIEEAGSPPDVGPSVTAEEAATGTAEAVHAEPTVSGPRPDAPARDSTAPAEPAPAEPAPAEPASAEPAPAEPAPAEPAPVTSEPPTPPEAADTTSHSTDAERGPAASEPASSTTATAAEEPPSTATAVEEPPTTATAEPSSSPRPADVPTDAASPPPPDPPTVATPAPETGEADAGGAADDDASTGTPAAKVATAHVDGASTLPSAADDADGDGEASTEPSRAASPDGAIPTTGTGAVSGAKKKKNKKKKKAK